MTTIATRCLGGSQNSSRALAEDRNGKATPEPTNLRDRDEAGNHLSRLIPAELLRELYVECVRRHSEWREVPWIEFQMYSGSSR